jgi:UPF0716 protein FxsA
MLGRLALLFVVIPLLELAVLIQVGQVVGLPATIFLVLATGVAGAALARREGLRTLTALQGELARGALPGQSLLDGLAILVGGAFLLTPGILTDVAGFLLLLPPTRRWVQRRVRKRIEKGLEEGTIRVMSAGSGGFGGWNAGWTGRPGAAGSDGPWVESEDDTDVREGLDPRMEIDVRE